MQKTDFQDYLLKDKVCSCGRIHRCEIETIILKENALSEIPELIRKNGYKKLCIVEDIHTKEALGEKVLEILKKENMVPQVICFEDDFLIPDEVSLGKIITEIDRDTDLILAVGSGTLNDICKFISFKMKIDYYIIATAPSMDGYASNVAPLITNHAKVTYEVSMPKAIIGELSVLKEAPMNMIAAGVGDVLGKYVCLMDWKLSHVVTGEYYCEEVVGLVEKAIDKVMMGTQKLLERDSDAIASVMEGLILSGIGMSYIGNSRPASGSEHHLSHYWEMMALLKNGHMELHGTKVAIGTIIGLKLYEKFCNDLSQPEVIDKWMHQKTEFDMELWSQEINRVYLDAADSVILLEKSCKKNAPEEMEKRKNSLILKQEILIDAMKFLPKAEDITAILKMLSAKYTPRQVEVDDQTLRDSILYAKELRNRYGILQVLKDFGIAYQYSDDIVNYFNCF